MQLIIDGTALATKSRDMPGVVAAAITSAADALVQLARHWKEPETLVRTGDAAAESSRFTIPSIVWRQALRVAIAVSVAYAFGDWSDLPFSYWGAAAVIVIMQPFGTNTWLRVFERAVGSSIGSLLAAILVSRLSNPFEIAVIIAPLAAGVIALRLVSYGLYVIFLTPMFMLTSDLIHPASHLIAARVLNEMIGAGVGLAGSLLLWPEKERDGLVEAVLTAVSANMVFAGGMLRAEAKVPDDIDLLRREAGLTSTRAEIARQRMVLQGGSRTAHLDRINAVLVAIRGICGATNVLWIVRRGEEDGPDRAPAERYDRLVTTLRAAATNAPRLPPSKSTALTS